MKKISVCIACYNEEKNIVNTYNRVSNVLKALEKYDYEIIIADNDSQDNSKEILRKLAQVDKHVKVIINMKNFGPSRSGKNCCYSATGDAIICMPCDLQEPPELIPEFVKYWEEGHLIVWGQKSKSKESLIKHTCRALFYKIIDYFSDSPQYKQTTGYGIIDKSVYAVIKELDEPYMAMRHLVAELGYPVKFIPYTQERRAEGKSSYNLWRYFDFAITSLVRTSRTPLRLATVIGSICSVVSFIIGIVYLVYKLLYWNSFATGVAPMVIAVLFLGSVQLMFIGIIGEYLGVVLDKVTKRPLVIEKERINFDDDERIKNHEE